MTKTKLSSFRTRLLAKELIVGTFVKTPSSIICEVLGLTELGAICLDAEHAPFGRMELDACVHALRAADMPSVVRVTNSHHEQIIQALDYGASGIVVPHVMRPEQAEDIVNAAHYGEGGRGYAGSTRAAGYTTKSMHTHIKESNNEATVIAQIEDSQAVDAIDEICAVKGIDCLFIGRNDLTVALKAESPSDKKVIRAVEKICAAGQSADKTVGMFVPNPEEARIWRENGASLFLLSSDHSFILSGAKNLCAMLSTPS